MNWYLVKIIFRIHVGGNDQPAQFDEQLRLIAAANKEEAFHKAQTIGRQGEEIFFNEKQKLVQWQFINVCALYKLSATIDGAELYSRIEESDDAGAYIEMIHKKAEHIQSGNTLEILELI
ncbi:MAG TPA: DUF4288 domain-containing protein [Chitinophagaceae bacterium]|nr:DUF4288 domain-containing protein [Chitinophagaceae bacterium]